VGENPKIAKQFRLEHFVLDDRLTQIKIRSWRVATMGRLAELQVVKWDIDEKGDSKFILK